jgi:hypothetical protein
MKHQSAWEVNNSYSVQYSGFSKLKTPDDGLLRPKHVVRKESEVLWCVNYTSFEFLKLTIHYFTEFVILLMFRCRQTK